MTQKKTHQSKKANGVTKAATVRLANGLTGARTENGVKSAVFPSICAFSKKLKA